VAIRTIPQADGERVLSRWLSDRSGVLADRDDLALAVRFSLQLLREKAPGRSVEVRIPPYGAAQVVEGPTHTRDTTGCCGSGARNLAGGHHRPEIVRRGGW